MGRSRFQVFARLDQASRAQRGTVTIERESGLFQVRPLRRRRVYELMLSDVASIVVRSILRAELAERRIVGAYRTRKRRRVWVIPLTKGLPTIFAGSSGPKPTFKHHTLPF